MKKSSTSFGKTDAKVIKNQKKFALSNKKCIFAAKKQHHYNMGKRPSGIRATNKGVSNRREVKNFGQAKNKPTYFAFA